MKRTIAAACYWLAAIVITLGAFGHGFVGVKPTRAAIEAATLAPDAVRTIWIVWYFVSGCMLVFGALLFWAWPALGAEPSSRSNVALAIGALYLISGIVAYPYSGRDPFWLLFVVLGVLVIGSTLVLTRSRGRRP